MKETLRERWDQSRQTERGAAVRACCSSLRGSLHGCSRSSAGCVGRALKAPPVQAREKWCPPGRRPQPLQRCPRHDQHSCTDSCSGDTQPLRQQAAQQQWAPLRAVRPGGGTPPPSDSAPRGPQQLEEHWGVWEGNRSLGRHPAFPETGPAD